MVHVMPYAEKFQIIPRVLNGRDAKGNDIWIDGAPIDVWGAFDQISGRHPTGRIASSGSGARAAGSVSGSEQTTEYDMIYLEQGSPVPGPFDAIMARGQRRNIAQLPTTYRNPFTGWTTGAVITLKAVEG